MKRRFFSLLTALVLCLTLLPATALASQSPAAWVTQNDVAQSYSTLQDAFDAVQACTESDNAVVRLQSGINTTSQLTIGGGVFTLDLFGQHINNADANTPAITMTGGTVTLTDSGTGAGTIGQRFVMDGGTLNMTGGTIKMLNVNPTEALNGNNSGTLNMTGGTIKKLYVDNGGTLNMTGGEISSNLVVGSKGEVQLSGGTYAWIKNDRTAVGKNSLGDLLAAGYAYQKGNQLLALSSLSNPITDTVTVVKCPHTGVSSGICPYCNANLVPSPVYVGGVQLLVGTKYVNDNGSVKVSDNDIYNAIVTGDDTNGYTLTINGLNVTGDANASETKWDYKRSAIYMGEAKSLTIQVDGASTATGAAPNSESGYSAGVYAKGALTIKGTAKLTAKGPDATNRYGRSCGIASDGGMTIQSEVEAIGGTTTSGSYGIFANSTLTIENAKIRATGGSAGESSVGVFGYSITINGDSTEINAASSAASFQSYGIGCSDDHIFLNGGTVEASGVKNAIATPFKTAAAGKEVKYIAGSDTFTKADYNDIVKNKTNLTVTLGTPAPVYKTVTFRTNGGALSGSDVATVATNSEYTMQYQVGVGMSALPTPTREGYTFDQWYGKQDFTGGAIGSIGSGSNMDLTLYAKWTVNRYTITFNTDGGTAVAPITQDYGAAITAPADPTKTGYTFAGWDKTIPTTMPAKNMIIKANWTPDQYTITYELNGGTNSANNPGTYTYGEGVNALAAPTRNGYTFAGWYASGDFSGNAVTAIAADRVGNMTLYAKWTPIPSGAYVPSYTVFVDKTDNGTVTASPKTAAKGTTVTVTVAPDKGYTLETVTALDQNGNELTLTDKGGGRYTFAMPASNVTVKATFMDDNAMLNFFVDVENSDYFYDAVLWAAKNGITAGTDETHFSPDQPCTRAQIVTFLWRAAGSPVVNYAMNLTDVPADSYYAEAVRWALSEGITTGTTATTFSPDETCTRAQAVAFLFRYAAPDAVTLQELTSSFADASSVPGYALSAMNWALSSGIVQGDGQNLMPNAACTRAQIVTLLYRTCSGK